MKKFKSELPAENGSEVETVDAGRRQALARLGLTAAIAYAAPTLLPLRSASAASGGDSGGGDGGNGGSNGGDDSGGSNSNDGGSSPSGGDDSGDDSGGDSSNDDSPTQPTEATSPSE